MLCTDFEWGFSEPMETPLPTLLATELLMTLSGLPTFKLMPTALFTQIITFWLPLSH